MKDPILDNLHNQATAYLMICLLQALDLNSIVDEGIAFESVKYLQFFLSVHYAKTSNDISLQRYESSGALPVPLFGLSTKGQGVAFYNTGYSSLINLLGLYSKFLR